MANTEVKDFVWLDAAVSMIIEDRFESRDITEDEHSLLVDYLEGNFKTMARCPDCSRALLVQSIDRGWDEGHQTDLKLFVCSHCGYWHYYESGKVDDHALSDRLVCAASHLKDFDERLPNGPADELSRYIRQNPERWHEISVLEMERLVADILKANHKHCEVKHVGQSGDGGKDVIFIDDLSNQWLVSCKRRERGSKQEEIDTLRNLLGVAFVEDVKFGIIASTSNRFAVGVDKLRKRALDRGVRVELLDKGILTRMLGATLHPRPWLKFVEYFAPEEAEFFEGLPPMSYGGYDVTAGK